MDRSRRLGEEKISKLLMEFSIPAVVAMFVNSIYNVVDRIFIGNGVGSLGIAGVTIGFPVMLLTMAFGMLVGIGATALISIRLGEQKNEEAERILSNGVLLLIIISFIISVVGLVFLEPILRLFGASEDVMPYAKEYMQVILLGTVFMSTGFGMSNFIRAEGNPRMSMYTMLLGAILNILLNPVFIFGLGWGVRGAAIATVLARTIATLWIFYYFMAGNSVLKLRFGNLKLEKDLMKGIFAIGAAPFAMQLANSILQVIMNNSLVNYGGDIAVAAMGVIMSFGTLLIMPVIGISQGAQPIIGYNYGAKKFVRVKGTLKLAAFAATLFVFMGFLVTRVYPEQIIAFFNSEDKQLIAIGTQALNIFFFALPIIGFQIVGANYFQATGKPKQAMFLSLSRQVVILIPLLLILPRFFGLKGIFFAGPISDVGSAVLTAIWLYWELKSLEKKQKQEDIKQIEPQWEN